MKLGAQVAKEWPVEADIVTGPPDSATAAAVGYARESGIPFAETLVKNRYVGRTFIMPDQRIRDQGVRIKFNPLREVLEGQRVVVVDDTMVRSTTLRHVVRMLRDAGAKEVHVRITAPPITHPCFFGIDTPRRSELIAAQKSLDEIRDFVEADSLAYLSVEGLLASLSGPRASYCTACWTGDYAVPIAGEDRRQAELFPADTELP